MQPANDELPPNRERGNDPASLPGLTMGLATLYSGSIEIDRAADDSVRAAIRAHYAGFPRRRLAHRWRIVSIGTAAAAAVVLAVILWELQPSTVPSPSLALHQPADFDRSGRVDILDAYRLARRLQSPQPPIDSSFDINADGTVDGGDVDAIAMQAVSLEQQGASS